MAFGILRCLTGGTKNNKFNILGRPHQAGQLEDVLAVRLSQEERATAARLFDRLQADDFVRSDYADLAQPENWVRLTEKGRNALQRGELDPLDTALAELAAHFVEMRAGAWAALDSSHPDALRQAAHSARDLLDQVLKTAAPDSVLQLKDRTPTRRDRIKHILWERGDFSESSARVVETAAPFITALADRLAAMAHSRVHLQQGEVRATVTATEIALKVLLLP